jgi:aminoglycoside phosphotransferase (APT) family kinase protein
MVRAGAPVIRASLVHRDLYLPNTLASARRFRCLLDFEHARSADAVIDFVKLKMWVFEAIAAAEADFCEGYGSDPIATNEGRLRYRAGLGLELLAGLMYWKKTRQLAMLADYQHRLRQWLGEMW